MKKKLKYCQEKCTKGDICKTLLTFNNEYTLTRTHVLYIQLYVYICPAKVFKRLMSGIRVDVFFHFILHVYIYMYIQHITRVYVGERVLLSRTYTSTRNIGSLFSSPVVLLSQEGYTHILSDSSSHNDSFEIKKNKK